MASQRTPSKWRHSAWLLLLAAGCATTQVVSAIGIDPRPPGEAPRREPATRQGRHNPLNARYGHLPALRVLHGKASFYHDSLSGNLTANGETYDKDRISAAHLTLPFCTVLRIVRKDTGHTVLVRINDRGPYGKRGRIIDLSRAAAEALGAVRQGVVPIRAEVLAWGDGCTFHNRH